MLDLSDTQKRLRVAAAAVQAQYVSVVVKCLEEAKGEEKAQQEEGAVEKKRGKEEVEKS